MTNVNVPLLRKAVEWVEEQDKLPLIDRVWNQGDWVTAAARRARQLLIGVPIEDRPEVAEQIEPHCGTAFCVAGYIGQMHDERYIKSQTVDGVHVSVYAADLLGLDYTNYDGEALHELFSGANSAYDIRQIAEELAGETM